MYATLLMDVEDLIDPNSDDVAKTCAEILAQEGAKATFCVVGERARQLERRGRGDVVAALKLHDVGLHSDFHSIHPTVLEYLQGLNWDDGVDEALRREEPGVRAIRQVFGVTPSCWAGPGNTWAPQINQAMRLLGVPAVVYAQTCVSGNDVHRFAGEIAYPIGHSFSDTWYADEIKTPLRLATLCQELKEDFDRGTVWKQIFLGHPTRLLHEEFWDELNFAGGSNPPPDQWRVPRRRTQDQLDLVLANFRRVIHALRALPQIELVTIREMNARLEPLPFTPLHEADFERDWAHIRGNLLSMKDWPILSPSLDVSEFCEATRRLLPTLERLDPDAVRRAPALTPLTDNAASCTSAPA